MKFKNIKGGTEKDAYNKFPWLERATFENADIDITNDYLIWEDGFWEGGWMWDNINQKYQSVVRKDGKFEIEQ